MNCQLTEIGKDFNGHSIFSNLSLKIEEKKNYVILGGNGSGKSTLIKIIAGGVSASEGIIEYTQRGHQISPEELPKLISFSAPYMDVIEEFTFEELIHFQGKFKSFQGSLNAKDIVKISRLQNIHNKPIRYFSSGMKQRVKLSLAVLSNAPFLLLDEPVSNLDPKGKLWYKQLLVDYAQNKTIIVSSNFLEEEFPVAPTFIELANFKG